MRWIRWGAVLMGVTSGLLIMALIALVSAVVINLSSASDLLFLVLLTVALFVAEFASGYVAGRFSGASQAFHGSLAGLGFYALSAAFLILDGSRAGGFALAFFAVVSAVVGGAGGLLAGRPGPEDGSPA